MSEDDWGIQSPPKREVFGFHYNFQKVIGSLGDVDVKNGGDVFALVNLERCVS